MKNRFQFGFHSLSDLPIWFFLAIQAQLKLWLCR